MSKTPTAKDLAAKYTAKLASSGLTLKDAKTLGFELLTAEQAERLGHKKVPCFRIPYWTPERKHLKFYRVRYLDGTKKGLMKQTTAKDQRYDQPSGVATELYLPSNWKRKWSEQFKNDERLFITEGELKAACACAAGLPTVALGGVWNFCARKRGINILPIFKDMNLAGKKVYIVFDSDAVTNPQVAAAENMLCRELMQLKAEPAIVRLPPIDSKKVGLDDYLIAAGVEAFQELVEQAQPFKLAAELHSLNEEVIYVENPSLVLRHRDFYKMSVTTFKNEVYANRTFIDFAGDKPRVVKTAEEWVRWEGRSFVERFVYEPGKPEYIDGALNLWKGLPHEPVKGDISPWNKLMDYVFQDDTKARKWFEQWCAYPLQHLGTKMFTAVVVWSVLTGTGKTLIGHTLQRIYGKENSIMIRSRDLSHGNNSFAENKQFILGEEITGDERRSLMDDLKSLITNEEVRINIKYVPEYTTRSCASYYFTSNNPDAFYLDEADRRFFVQEIVGLPLPDEWYRGVYDPWYKSDAGISALLHHFLTMDLSGFDHRARAPMTTAKLEMIENSRSGLATWVHMLRECPDDILRSGSAVLPYSLWTTEDLLKVYDPEGRTRATGRTMAIELKRARMPKVNKGMGCRMPSGKQPRLWAVRDADKLGKLDGAELGKLYAEERAVETKEKKFAAKGGKK